MTQEGESCSQREGGESRDQREEAVGWRGLCEAVRCEQWVVRCRREGQVVRCRREGRVGLVVRRSSPHLLAEQVDWCLEGAQGQRGPSLGAANQVASSSQTY